jgi:RHS repeat-associated protein
VCICCINIPFDKYLAGITLRGRAESNAAAAAKGLTAGSGRQQDCILQYDGQNNLVDTTDLRGGEGKDTPTYTSYGETYRYGNGIGTGHFKGYEPGVYGYQTGVRNYDPQTGRFLSPDPFKGYLSEPASQNPYMYCRGNLNILI